MTLNRLQLNDEKTEAVLVMSKKTGLIPKSMSIGDTDDFSDLVKNLGVTLDSILATDQLVTNTCIIAYIDLRRISSICQYLTVDATKTPISAFVLFQAGLL